jgi:hypothetical protein
LTPTRDRGDIASEAGDSRKGREGREAVRLADGEGVTDRLDLTSSRQLADTVKTAVGRAQRAQGRIDEARAAARRLDRTITRTERLESATRTVEANQRQNVASAFREIASEGLAGVNIDTASFERQLRAALFGT